MPRLLQVQLRWHLHGWCPLQSVLPSGTLRGPTKHPLGICSNQLRGQRLCRWVSSNGRVSHPKFERAQVLQRCAAWVSPLSLGLCQRALDTVRRLMPVTFRAVSLRRADEETTPGVHCLNEIAVKDKPLPEVARTAERQCLCAEKEAQPVVRLELAHEWTKLWMPTIPWSADAHSVRGDLQNRTRGHRTMRGMNPIWARCCHRL